jgi:hypothetical protein
MSAAEQAIPIQQPGGPACGSWMRRQKAHCARQAGHPGQHGVRPDPVRVLIDGICGIWIERAGSPCARRPLHRGDHRTAEALADKRPRRTTRRSGVRGVRRKPDPEARRRWYMAYKFKRLGISEAEFDRRLEQQGYACPFCGEPFEDGQRIVVDHDHNCCPLQPDRIAKTCGECIRGLLHWGCNTKVGYVELYRAQVDKYLAWSATRAA